MFELIFGGFTVNVPGFLGGSLSMSLDLLLEIWSTSQ